MKNYDAHRVGHRSDQGPTRTDNQDALWVCQATDPTHLGALYIVADGVGGQEHGATAATLAARVVHESFYRARQQEQPIQAALESALHEANLAVFREAELRGSHKMGCTMVTAVQYDGRLYVAHVGDARAYMLHEGKLHRMTRDDTWVQKQVEAGLITPEQAAKHELRNVVTQVLGNTAEITVHLSKPYELKPHDVLLLCSDGLYDAVSGARIQEILQQTGAQAAAEQLVATAVENQASDNITAVVVQCGPAAGGFPRWLPLAVVGLILLLAVGALVWSQLTQNRVPQSILPSPQTTDSTLPPSTATAIGGAAPGGIPPQVTSTIAPTPSPTPLPTETAVPSPTPVELACILYNDSYIWTDNQLEQGCGQFAAISLPAGTQVELTQTEPKTVSGPDVACLLNTFRRIRAVNPTPDAPPIEGWVLANGLGPRPPEGCSP